MNSIKLIAKKSLAHLIDVDVDLIDIDSRLFEYYSLTSLNLVIMITNICDETDIPVFKFTDTDIANLRTLRDVITMFTTAANQDD